jgi:ABC-type nitrate/sulfonate/bicarbonate transport system permease component
MDSTAPITESTMEVPALERPMEEIPPIKRFWQRFGPSIVTVINLSIFVIIWQIIQAGDNPIIDTRFIPTPVDMFKSLWKNLLNGILIDHTIFSGTNYLVGMAISIGLGIPLGIFLGLNPVIRSITQTYVWMGYSTPTIAIQPIIIVILGFGIASKVFLIVLMTFFPIMVNVLAGVATVDPVLLKAGRLFGADKKQLFTKIIVPFTLPWIMTGIRLASRRGLIAVIVAEIFGSVRGLAYYIIRKAEVFESEKSFSAIVLLMVISLIVINGMAWIEQKATPWRVAYKI